MKANRKALLSFSVVALLVVTVLTGFSISNSAEAEKSETYQFEQLASIDYVGSEADLNCGEGKCGEGKCGDGDSKESKKEAKNADKEKCGEGKCSESKCGDGEDKESKCGEGKCGE
jgi:uncharacterized low-complexity protein